MDIRLPLLTLLICPQTFLSIPLFVKAKHISPRLHFLDSVKWQGPWVTDISVSCFYSLWSSQCCFKRSEICQAVSAMITLSFKEWCVLKHMSMLHTYSHLAFETQVPEHFFFFFLGKMMGPPVRIRLSQSEK